MATVIASGATELLQQHLQTPAALETGVPGEPWPPGRTVCASREVLNRSGPPSLFSMNWCSMSAHIADCWCWHQIIRSTAYRGRTSPSRVGWHQIRNRRGRPEAEGTSSGGPPHRNSP